MLFLLSVCHGHEGIPDWLNKLVNGTNTTFSHYFTQLFGNKHHKVDYIFRFAFESLSEFGDSVLQYQRDRYRDYIHASLHSPLLQGEACGKAEFLCTEHTRAIAAIIGPLRSFPSVSITTLERSPCSV